MSNYIARFYKTVHFSELIPFPQKRCLSFRTHHSFKMSLNLADVDNNQLKSIFDSFDNVLCDCDGVIWHSQIPIPGVDESLSILKKIGKNVRFVTNNSYLGLENFCKKFKTLNIDAEPSDVANPCLAIINHLKKIDFTRNIWVIGSSGIKQELKDAGFNVVDLEVPGSVSEDTGEALIVLTKLLQSARSIGAIIFDVDINLNYLKLNLASVCLQNPDVLFLTACADRVVPLTSKIHGIGPEYFIKPIQDLTGREPIAFGKPGKKMTEFFLDKFKIDNPSRTLFIGDSLEYDIGFASKLGYQTLLVLTGATQLEDVKNCTNKDSIPDFYLKSLGDLHEIMKNKDL